MQVLAPADPFSLWLHGVGHDGLWRRGIAPAFSPRPACAAGGGRSSASVGARPPFFGLAAMTGGDAGPSAAAGASARHVPALLREVIANLAPRDGGVYIDGTLGAGGYTAAILAAANAQVIGIDRDPTAV